MSQYPDFNRVAFGYDFLKTIVFGENLERAQIVLVDHIPPKARILIVGGGTGEVVNEIMERWPVENITFVELSNKMIDIAIKKVKPEFLGKVNFVHGTPETLRNDASFNIILTPFVLDLYSDISLLRLMKCLDHFLIPHGKWLFCDFQITGGSLGRKLWQKGLANLMYFFFGMTSNLQTKVLPDYDTFFERLGYKSIYHNTFYGGFIHSKVWVKRGY